MRYSRYNTENMLKIIKIIAKEKETMCATRFVIMGQVAKGCHVMLL